MWACGGVTPQLLLPQASALVLQPRGPPLGIPGSWARAGGEVRGRYSVPGFLSRKPPHVLKNFLLLHCFLGALSQRKKLRYSDLDFEVSGVCACVCVCMRVRVCVLGNICLWCLFPEGPLLTGAKAPLQSLTQGPRACGFRGVFAPSPQPEPQPRAGKSRESQALT